MSVEEGRDRLVDENPIGMKCVDDLVARAIPDFLLIGKKHGSLACLISDQDKETNQSRFINATVEDKDPSVPFSCSFTVTARASRSHAFACRLGGVLLIITSSLNNRVSLKKEGHHPKKGLDHTFSDPQTSLHHPTTTYSSSTFYHHHRPLIIKTDILACT